MTLYLSSRAKQNLHLRFDHLEASGKGHTGIPLNQISAPTVSILTSISRPPSPARCSHESHNRYYGNL